MALIDLKGPDSHSKLPCTVTETPESGWSFKRIVDALNAMFSELYTAVDAVDSPAGLPLPRYSVANVPATPVDGLLIYVADGAAGAAIVAFSAGGQWLRCDTGAAISAS